MLRTPRRALISLVLPLLLAGSPPALAVGDRTLFTAEDAVRMALHNDRTLRSTRRDVEAAAGRAVEAGRFPAPELEVGLLRPTRNADGRSSRVETALGWDVSALLRRGGLGEAARFDLEAARLRADAAKVRLAYEVESAYHVLAAARGVLAVARTRSELVALAADSARAVADAGNAPPLPHLREAARREAAGIALAEAALAVLEAEERLVALLGGGVAGVRDAVAGVGAEPPALAPGPPDVSGLEEVAVAASLELAELRARLHAAEARARLAKAETRRPGLEVRLLAEREEGGWGAGAELALRLPSFDRGRGRSAALEAEAGSAAELLAGTEVLVRSAARVAASRLSAAHARAARLTGPVRSFHERIVAESLLQANAMQIGIADLLAARDAALRAEANAADALRDLAIADAAVRALRSGIRPADSSSRPLLSTETAPAEGGH